jgi:serine/threonine protein kinase/tetratricopeptide (TPR) repeat protein
MLMSEAEDQKNKRPQGKEAGPTQSFDGTTLGPGSQIGPFRIEQELGRGGAGVVYLAHDTKLDRSVAIKSLPAEVKGNPKALSRFTREARVLASLNHPNIATIYDELEEAGGLIYLILEYVPGQTLAERIAKKPLKLEEALTIALQIAKAVAAAHEHDVIHRDLKPGNIKITEEGKVKVLDFGLAKVVGGEATDQQTTITEPGRVIGTPAYMSPEQARGKATDKRSDIWSFGCILYEMLTATVPFKGETISDTLANILQTEPRWETLPENIPTNIRSLLRHCLKKDPRRRLQHIGDATIEIEDTTADLQRSTLPTKSVRLSQIRPTGNLKRILPWLITSTAMVVMVLLGIIIGLKLGQPSEKPEGKPISQSVAETIKAIVVLPFENLSGDPEQEYFVEGMRDALGTELGKIRALTIKGQHSATLYKGTNKQTPYIARELGVDAVITGSVFKAANNVRITAQLIHGPTEENIWADSYQGDLADVLTLQREVALAIANEIKVKLTPQEEERLASARPINPQAHDAYLKGRFFLSKRNEEGFRTAISYFEQAKDLDPDFALSYVGLADCYILQGHYDFAPSQEVYSKAKEEALQALAIDDSLGEAHNSLAYAITSYDWDWSEAEREFQQAIELNPHYSTAHHWYACFLGWMGHFDEALVEIEHARDLEPLSLIIRSIRGYLLCLAGKYDESIEQLHEVLQMDPDFLPALYFLAATHIRKSMFEENIALYRKAATLRGRDAASVACLAFANAAAGNTREAQTLLQEALDRSKEEHIPPYVVAVTYAHLNDKDRAVDWLYKALEQRHNSATTLKVDPLWDPLRKDPRFSEALKRMNFPEVPDSEPAAKLVETAQAPIEKIAVLPFTSISSEAGEEWFVDGMTDALITQLGKIKALTVISRTSAMQYKNISKPMPEIAQDLGVDALIEGSVIRAGNDVQVTARLIDGRTDERIWGDFFQGTFSNILSLQSQVTLAIAQQIEIALTPDEQRRIARTDSINPKAYEAFLKGRFFYFKFTEAGFKSAIDYLEQAVAIDPNYAEAYAGLADAYWGPTILGYAPPGESFRKAKSAANTAIKLDDSLSVVHTVVGYMALFYDWDWEKAEQSFNLARELNPNDPFAHLGLAWYFVVVGRLDEAVDATQTALKLDPLSLVCSDCLGIIYMLSRQFEQAIEQYEKTLELDPNYLRTIINLTGYYMAKSMYPEAITTIKRAMTLAGRTPDLVAMLARAYALSNRKDEAETLLQELQERSRDEYVLPSDFASLHVALGNVDEAFRWLEEAYKERDWGILFLRYNWGLDPLRSDPRFDDFVRRMKYPE